MLKLGLDGFVRNITKNIIVIIQIAMIIILSTLMVAIYDSQTRMSNSVMKYIDDTGAYILPDTSKWDEESVLRMPGVKNHIYAAGSNAPVYLDGYDCESKGNCDFVAYDEEKVEYRPELKSGKWYSDVKEKSNTINVVIAENDYGFGVGDKLKVKLICNDGSEKEIVFNITGVVYNRTMLFGLNNEYTNMNNSYISLFSNAKNHTSVINKKYEFIAIMSMSDIEKYNLYVCQKNGIIDYEDDISEEQMDKNNKELRKMALVSSTENMKSNSEKLLFSKLAGIFIIFMVVFVITIASIICSGAVSYMYERRNYGIFYMTGNTWNNTMLLFLINWIMVLVSSIILSIFVFSMGMVFGYIDSYAISYSLTTFVVHLVIVLFVIFTAMIIPYIKMRRSQPVNVIRNNE